MHHATNTSEISVTIENNFELLINNIVEQAQPGDHLLVMSNGGFGGIHQKLLDGLAAKFSDEGAQ